MTRSRKNRKPFDPLAVYEHRGFNWILNPEKKKETDPIVLFLVYQFKCPCAHPYYCEWDSPNAGADKGEYCQNPDCASREPVLPYGEPKLSKTPCSLYQEKFTGNFQCHNVKCRKNWTSGHAWTNKYQKCERCQTKVYPYDMYVRDKPKPRPGRAGRPHNRDFCEKCIKLKIDCSVDLDWRGAPKSRRLYKTLATDMSDGIPIGVLNGIKEDVLKNIEHQAADKKDNDNEE